MKGFWFSFGAMAMWLCWGCSDGVVMGGDTEAPAQRVAESIVEPADTRTRPNDWFDSGTVHLGEVHSASLLFNQRRIYTLFTTATPAFPVSLSLETQTNVPVQLAVLAPAGSDGKSAAVASAGYATPVLSPKLSVKLTQPGRYRVVVASYKREHAGQFSFRMECDGRGCPSVGAIVSPVPGALVNSRSLDVRVNDGLCGQTVELWSSLPPFHFGRKRLGSAVADGCMARFVVPPSVSEGDDLILTVPGVESGVRVRLWTQAGPATRAPSMTSAGATQVWFTGVGSFNEGTATFELRDPARDVLLGDAQVEVDQPGQSGTGFSAFDARLEIPEDRLPVNGQILSFGQRTEGNTFNVMGCFQYCGDETCSIVPVACR